MLSKLIPTTLCGYNQELAYSEKEVYENSRIQTCPSTSTNNNCAIVLYSRINLRWLTKGHILVAADMPKLGEFIFPMTPDHIYLHTGYGSDQFLRSNATPNQISYHTRSLSTSKPIIMLRKKIIMNVYSNVSLCISATVHALDCFCILNPESGSQPMEGMICALPLMFVLIGGGKSLI